MFSKFKEKYKLGNHYKIERFGIKFVVLFLALSITIGIGIKSKYVADRDRLKTISVYTKEFRSSRTGVSGKVKNVFVNKDRTKTFILLQMPNINEISTNAEEYQMFLTTAKVSGNKQILNSKPAGSIYMFGTTGYMGLYLVNQNGFDSQILDITVRANSELVPIGRRISGDDVDGDKSFAKYDQFKIFVNPGAENAILSNALDEDQIDVTFLYQELVVNEQEKLIKDELAESLNVMSATRRSIDEFTRRLVEFDIDGKSIIPAEEPKDIIGDKLVTKEVNKEKVTYLESNFTYAKGLNFNWQDGNVKDGYIKKLKDPKMSTLTWIAELNKQKDQELDSGLTAKWLLSDGSNLDDLTQNNGSLTLVKGVVNTVTQLTNKWIEYQNLKRDYQTVKLRKLIDLEITLDNVKSNHNINTKDNVLRVY